jgi:hypothetical protein
MTGGEARRAMQVVVEKQEFLVTRWEAIHGRTD